eukprot:9908909-Alexandrium_andersonii.AAC.1
MRPRSQLAERAKWPPPQLGIGEGCATQSAAQCSLGAPTFADTEPRRGPASSGSGLAKPS